MMEQGDGYYVALGSNGHVGPSSPGTMMASPMSIADQYSPSVAQSQAATCHYRHSTKPSTLPATMNHFAPTYTSTLSPSNHLHTADPASPMQTTYSHMGFPPEGACTVPSIPPPPNYSEATAMTTDVRYQGHLPPNYNSIMIASEYSSQTRPRMS